MLNYNFERVFRAKGITRPFSFLRQAGFSDSFSTKVKNSRVNRLSLVLMERLCLSIGCTPNDFLEWTPERNQNVDKNHPLNELKRSDKIMDLTMTLHSLPLSKLEAIERFLEEENKDE